MEKQVTIGETTFNLERPFLVLATQNPIEQEGTYPLPEAQLDRFMLKISIDYPDQQDESEILDQPGPGGTAGVQSGEPGLGRAAQDEDDHTDSRRHRNSGHAGNQYRYAEDFRRGR